MGFNLKKLIFIAMLVLTACGGLHVKEVPLETPQIPPTDAKPIPIGFSKIRLAVPTGVPVTSSSAKGLLGWFACSWPYGVTGTGLRGRRFPSDEWREIFIETMEGLGYSVTGSPSRLFDESADLKRTQLSVGGRVTDVKIDSCNRRSFFFGVPLGEKGEGEITIEWTVYDVLQRKTMYKTSTSGYAELRQPNLDGIQLLFEEAMASAIHNLGTDREFYELVFHGMLPEKVPETYQDPDEQPGIFDPQERISLPDLPLSKITANGRFDSIRNSAVLVQLAGGHGSGFFVSREGHIITNAHVVGNAKRARIVSSGKYNKMVAEVLRLDRHRDVALLKLIEVPPDLEFSLLPIRTDKLIIGEDIYAIGAPLRTGLQDTVTKGIVSAHRYDRRRQLWFIQGDVDIHGGNSGGPLIDAFGNIVGITVKGVLIEGKGIGLNQFIPITDALKRLEIPYDERHGIRQSPVAKDAPTALR